MKKLNLKSINWGEIKEQFEGIQTFDDLLEAGNAPKIATIGCLFLGILAGGYYFLGADVNAQIDASLTKQEELKNTYKEAFSTASNLKKYEQDLENTKKSVDELLKQLPNRSNIDSLLSDVNKAGLGRELVFQEFTPKSEKIEENFYASLPIDMKIEGTYANIGTFANDVAKLDRIVNFNSFALRPINDNKIKSQDELKLSLTLTAETYRYLDDAEIEALNAQNKKKGKK